MTDFEDLSAEDADEWMAEQEPLLCILDKLRAGDPLTPEEVDVVEESFFGAKRAGRLQKLRVLVRVLVLARRMTQARAIEQALEEARVARPNLPFTHEQVEHWLDSSRATYRLLATAKALAEDDPTYGD